MRRVVLALPVLLLACAHAAQPPFDAAIERDYYDQTVASLTGESQAPIDLARIDYRRLRRAAVLARQDDAIHARRHELIRQLAVARSRRDEAALAIAHALLALDFTDVEAHLEKARHLHHRDGRAASFHEALALGLLDSMLAEGVGRDRAHPIRIFSMRESTAVLAHLGLTPRRQGAAPKVHMAIEATRGADLQVVWFDFSAARD